MYTFQRCFGLGLRSAQRHVLTMPSPKHVVQPVSAALSQSPWGISSRTIAVSSGQMRMISVSHAIPNFASWLAEYKIQAETGPHKEMFLETFAGEGPLRTDDKPTTHVIGIFSASMEADVKGLLNFDGPPFVGGADLIEKGIVIPPFDVVSSRIVNHNSHAVTDEPEMMVSVTHRVANFNEWLVEYKNAVEAEKNLGVLRSFAGEGEPHADGSPTVHVVWIFPASMRAGIEDFLKAEGPPFVGGPDLIAKGVVIPPFDVVCSTQVFNK
mmetsp:Transcript_88262/g.156269  ORF Transcript_88262/g.156269 Transcript_88262/m.156269 type:complete len:268 (+) Transcript_88262:93-896(+)